MKAQNELSNRLKPLTMVYINTNAIFCTMDMHTYIQTMLSCKYVFLTSYQFSNKRSGMKQ